MSNLHSDIVSFCARHRLAKSRFGKMAVNDSAFVFQFGAGRRVWPEAAERVRASMAEYHKQATPVSRKGAEKSLTSVAGGKACSGEGA